MLACVPVHVSLIVTLELKLALYIVLQTVRFDGCINLLYACKVVSSALYIT